MFMKDDILPEQNEAIVKIDDEELEDTATNICKDECTYWNADLSYKI